MKKATILGFAFYLQDQCISVRLANTDLKRWIRLKDLDRTWYSLRGLLYSVACISKTFWPRSRSYTDRGKELRLRYGIPDDSPIQSRKMRNQMDHFDECFQKWMKGHPGFSRGGINWGTKSMLPLQNPQLGFLDCPTMTVVFLGKTWMIDSVVRAVSKLLPEIERDIREIMSRVTSSRSPNHQASHGTG